MYQTWANLYFVYFDNNNNNNSFDKCNNSNNVLYQSVFVSFVHAKIRMGPIHWAMRKCCLGCTKIAILVHTKMILFNGRKEGE